jgi:hypothetical protein
MDTFLRILCFLIFAKFFLFWVWMWQLKEYHIGRFFAHFETQAFSKIISSAWRLRAPHFTKKIILICGSGLLLALIAIFNFSNPLITIVLITLSPIFTSLWVLLFQIPTVVLRRRILNAARAKRAKMTNLLVVGVTGSYGKTSTKEFLYDILSTKWGDVLKTDAHQNSLVEVLP